MSVPGNSTGKASKAKRNLASASDTQNPDDVRCQVPGCGVRLSTLKVYNQRCRVCQEHLVAPNVDFEGSPKRFCQQCARFHFVDEFDGNKRSCRVRLERHKIQRRKRKCQAAEVENDGGYGATPIPPLESAGITLKQESRNRAGEQWGNLMSQTMKASLGPSSGWTLQEEEGESICPSLSLHPFATNFRDSVMARTYGNVTGNGPMQLKNTPDVPTRAAPAGWGEELTKAKEVDPGSKSFMDAVLMKLHDDEYPLTDLQQWDSWPTSLRQDQLEAHNVATTEQTDQLFGAASPNMMAFPSDWGIGSPLPQIGGNNVALPFGPVGDMGYRNIQECIEDLPIAEQDSFFESKVPSRQIPAFQNPDPEGGQLSYGANQGRVPAGFNRTPVPKVPVSAPENAAPVSGALVDSVLRVLHENEEDVSCTSTYPSGEDPLQMGAIRPGGFRATTVSGFANFESMRSHQPQPHWYPGRFE